MSYCLNPNCPQPKNLPDARFCETCGRALLLGDRYRSLQLLGQGGFGRTFLARDEAYDPEIHGTLAQCVIKQFSPTLSSQSDRRHAADLFHQEADQLWQLGKLPQIPELYDYLEIDGEQYLIQEFIDGPTLADELKSEGPFDELQVRQVLNSLLPVLQALHDRQIIHRDIKPTNILRRKELPSKAQNLPGSGELVLVDFGASKYVTPELLSRTGTTIGSAAYAAPEQVMGKAVFASDIYSLGVTCIHLLTGMHPFDLYSASEDTWIWQDYRIHPVSDRLTDVLNKMLQRATRDRFRRADAVLQALHRSVGPVVRVSRPVPTLQGNEAAIEVAAPPLELAPPDTARIPQTWDCVFTLIGHAGPVEAIAISPDGQILASGSTDNSIKLWELGGGRLLHTFPGRSLRFPSGHNARIRALAFSSDGRILISGSDDCTLKWWDMETRTFLQQTPEHGWSIAAIAISQNGRLVASGGGDGLVDLWEIGSGAPIARLQKHRDAIGSLLLSPDGKTLISASDDSTIRLWDLESDRIIRTLRGHNARVSAVGISTNWLSLISASTDETIRFWDLSNGRVIDTFLAHRAGVTCLALAANNRLLATGGEDNRIKLWNLTQDEAGRLRRTGERPLSLPSAWSVKAIAFSPDSRVLVSGSDDETIRIWQAI
ncbi:protein kinase domain-containing protein [Vacuolonema iberomarrocanum]|uniref:protein kinase domain-containing protein n=1 Tax=Vacuolonema iberomarrocanum TaxID=3454632 RepID=UPI0019EEA837|nr:serine/threonine protein kinase [filamentous cyanobacterium LEGE 07170]